MAACAADAAGRAARAGVVVLCNRTSDTVAMEILGPDGDAARRDLPPRDVVAVPAKDDEKIAIRYRTATEVRLAELPASSIYGFFQPQGKVELLPLLAPPPPAEGEPIAEPATPPPVAEICVVPVKILTDDDEATRRSYWEPVLRKRMAEASKIFEEQCRVRFEVVAVDTWDSDDSSRILRSPSRSSSGRSIPGRHGSPSGSRASTASGGRATTWGRRGPRCTPTC